MDGSAPIGMTLLIFGVLAIVLGAVLVIGGSSELNAAKSWTKQPHVCSSSSTTYDANGMPRPSHDCSFDNPHSGGGIELMGGLVLAIGGGGLAYYGAKT